MLNFLVHVIANLIVVYQRAQVTGHEVNLIWFVLFFAYTYFVNFNTRIIFKNFQIWDFKVISLTVVKSKILKF